LTPRKISTVLLIERPWLGERHRPQPCQRLRTDSLHQTGDCVQWSIGRIPTRSNRRGERPRPLPSPNRRDPLPGLRLDRHLPADGVANRVHRAGIRGREGAGVAVATTATKAETTIQNPLSTATCHRPRPLAFVGMFAASSSAAPCVRQPSSAQYGRPPASSALRR
jgi:hypothetical protein